MTITESQRRTLDLMAESAGWNWADVEALSQEMFGECVAGLSLNQARRATDELARFGMSRPSSRPCDYVPERTRENAMACARCGQPAWDVCYDLFLCDKHVAMLDAGMSEHARRQAQHAPGATSGGRAVSGATIHHSGAPARLQRFGETAAIVPSETKPARTAPMTDAEFAGLLARERREIIERGGLLVDPDWKHKNVRGMGVSE